MTTAITTIIVAFITTILGPILVEWVKSKLAKQPKISSVKEAIDLNELVDHQLDVMMDELGCDRIWIGQFHNGGHFYPTGKSIQKFSMFYEKVAPGNQPSQQSFQNVPVSLFPKAMTELYKNGEIAVPDTEGETYGLGSAAEPYGAQSYYLIALDDLHDRFIGVLCVDFQQKYKLSKEDWIFIRQKAGVIGTLLDEYLNAKK